MYMEQGNYAQIEAYKVNLFQCKQVLRNAEIPGLRARVELGHDEGSNNYYQ